MVYVQLGPLRCSVRQGIPVRTHPLSPCAVLRQSCAHLSFKEFAERPPDVQDAQPCAGIGVTLGWRGHSGCSAGDTEDGCWWLEEGVRPDGESLWHSLKGVSPTPPPPNLGFSLSFAIF